MTSTNALAVNKSGTTITTKVPGVVLGLLAAVALLAAPAAAFGAETTTTLNGYTATPTLSTSSTTSVATTTVATTSAAAPVSSAKPESESKPTTSESTPKSSVKPSSSSASPATATTTTTAKTLPFTGLNLAWVIGAGLLLLALGLTMRVLQRRAHR